MITPEERSTAVAEALNDDWVHRERTGMSHIGREARMVWAYAAAIRAAENDALERAAQCFDEGGAYWRNPVPVQKAAYIRALKHNDAASK